MKQLIILSLLICTSSFASEFLIKEMKGGSWEVKESKLKIPRLRVDVDPKIPNVSVEFNKPNKTEPKSIGITFFDSQGNKTVVKLKAMDRSQHPLKYQAPLSKAESFVGFELKIPYVSAKPTIIHSSDMKEVK